MYNTLYVQGNATCTSSCATLKHCSTWRTRSTITRAERSRPTRPKTCTGPRTRTCYRYTDRQEGTHTSISTWDPRTTCRAATPTNLLRSVWPLLSSTLSRRPATCRCYRLSPPHALLQKALNLIITITFRREGLISPIRLTVSNPLGAGPIVSNTTRSPPSLMANLIPPTNVSE